MFALKCTLSHVLSVAAATSDVISISHHVARPQQSGRNVRRLTGRRLQSHKEQMGHMKSMGR